MMLRFLLFGLALLSMRVLLATPDEPASPPEAVSSIRLCGVPFAIHHRPPESAPPAPDLSRAGRHRLPRDARFEVPLPLLWGDRVVPPGEYQLGVVVSSDYELLLELQPTRGGAAIAVALESGVFSAPARAVTVQLSRQQIGEAERGLLLVRWEALTLLAEFVPVAQQTMEAAGLRFSGFAFPETLAAPDELFLGHLIELEGEHREYRMRVKGLGSERAVLHLEDRRTRQLLDERATLQQELALLREGSEKDQQDPVAAQQRVAEQRRLENRLKGVEARLERLDPAATAIELVATTREVAAGRAFFAAGLEAVEGTPFLTLRVGHRLHTVPLGDLVR